jgi:hypothetical protein
LVSASAFCAALTTGLYMPSQCAKILTGVNQSSETNMITYAADLIKLVFFIMLVPLR